MSSRLSSLLVRDGLVGVKRMEQAFQRQVIYGGALDTILLEMGALTEERLAEYLSLSSGLPPADRNLYDYFDPRAVQVCPRELAEEFHVAPVAFDNDALRVLVSDPVDLGVLEALATRIGAPIQPFVVPEFRFALIVERLFGVPTPSRYISLAAKQAAARRPQLPEPKVIVEDLDIRRVSETPNVRTRTGPMSTDTVARALERQEVQRRINSGSAPPIPVSSGPVPPVGPKAALAVLSSSGPARPALAPGVPAPPAHDIEADTPRLRAAVAPVPSAVPHVIRTAEGTQIVRLPWRHTATGVDPTPLEPAAALVELRGAGDRDAIFHALVRGVRARTRFAASMVVQGDMAFGREALDDNADDPVTQVAIPLAGVPAFKTAVASGSPYIGPIATGDRTLDAQLARLGGAVPPTGLILPVVIKTRVVLVVYAHRGAEPLSVSEVADVLPLAAEAAVALSKLILRAKSAGYGRAPSESHPPVLTPGESPGRRRAAGDSGRWRRASTPTVVPPALGAEAASLVTATATAATAAAAVPPAPSASDSFPPRRSVDQLLTAIEGGGPGATEAYDEALQRVEDTLVALRRRLPGKLWVDRYASVRPTRASQHGPLLALVVRLGEKAVPLLTDCLASDDRELRYYATLACSELRHPQLVHALVLRLFDADHGVRPAALDALVGFPARDTNHALEPIRNALHGDAARARAAAGALGALRDVGAIPDLIAATERDHSTAEEARRALVQLTKQDFGTKAKKWRAWWEKNHERPRVEWMLDGLAHPDDEVRLSASEELKRVTGEYFGYHYDLPRRDREEARLKWLRWWEEIGKRRFMKEEIPEAARPTAMLPQHPRRS